MTVWLVWPSEHASGRGCRRARRPTPLTAWTRNSIERPALALGRGIVFDQSAESSGSWMRSTEVQVFLSPVCHPDLLDACPRIAETRALKVTLPPTTSAATSVIVGAPEGGRARVGGVVQTQIEARILAQRRATVGRSRPAMLRRGDEKVRRPPLSAAK